MKIEIEIKLDGVRDVVRLAALSIAGIALYQELSKPPLQRTWHGTVGSTFPYDFRPPTLERVRDSYWNPDSPDLFTPAVFGVGWAINIPTLARNVGRWAKGGLSETRAKVFSRR